ncbi:MAG: thermonuclease family protein, partial [Caldisericaceae bacterium]|nr:thermonuclease family protein [Caldisericaceae bacterium]
LLAYVYLKNKTFINAHLIKHGFAKVDRAINFNLKNKFLKMEQVNG